MSNVINMADFRKSEPVPIEQLVEEAAKTVEEILYDWEKMAKNNRLNEYFCSTAPSIMKEGVGYLYDLNELSRIEHIIQLSPTILGPGTITTSQWGWVVRFTVKEPWQVSTPQLPSETHARAFAIILFMKMKRLVLQQS